VVCTLNGEIRCGTSENNTDQFIIVGTNSEKYGSNIRYLTLGVLIRNERKCIQATAKVSYSDTGYRHVGLSLLDKPNIEAIQYPMYKEIFQID
jgi:hypothetical protein